MHGNRMAQKDWEDLGTLDAHWAVLSDPNKRYGKWDEEEFYKSGEEFIAGILTKMKSYGVPQQQVRALDFGCGVGRITYGLADHFASVIGIDVSTTMLEKAKAAKIISGAKKGRCEFNLNTRPNLEVVASDSIDMVCSYIVLQHVPEKKVIENYIAEFVRILKPGGLIFFQVPTFVPVKNRIQLRRRAYGLLRQIGFQKEFLYSTLGLHPIYYNFISEKVIQKILSPCSIIHEEHFQQNSSSVRTSNYYVTK